MSNEPDSRPAIAVADDPKVAEVPGDPAIFRALLEISITAALANRMLGRQLPDGLTEAQFGCQRAVVEPAGTSRHRKQS